MKKPPKTFLLTIIIIVITIKFIDDKLAVAAVFGFVLTMPTFAITATTLKSIAYNSGDTGSSTTIINIVN